MANILRSALRPPRLAFLLLLALPCGCSCLRPQPSAPQRAFDFQHDTFAYPNELVWTYQYDTNGNWTTHARKPKPTYTLHCLVVARSTRQFFENARFAAECPKTNEVTYRKLIHRVVTTDPRHPLPEDKKIVIPGYADLRGFSHEQETLLKACCGSAWQSYLARGNWRMIFPFTRKQQTHAAEQLLEHWRPDHPLLIHVSRFPQLSINHTLLIFGAHETDQVIRFDVYDPNYPDQPTFLVFDRATRTFYLPPNGYFQGGHVDVYEVFHKWDY